jgi:hypothetical protein
MYHEASSPDTSPGYRGRKVSKLASNKGQVLAEKDRMRVLLRACEQTESDDDQQSDEPSPKRYRPEPRRVLWVRCYACAGSGQLEVIDDPSSNRGRIVRCIACRGTGSVAIK